MDSTFDMVQIVVAAVAGVVVFAIAVDALKSHSLFSHPRLLAFCVAALAGISLLGNPAPVPSDDPRDPAGARPLVEFILLPYAALALTLLLLLLLAAALKLFGCGGRRLRRSGRGLRVNDRSSEPAGSGCPASEGQIEVRPQGDQLVSQDDAVPPAWPAHCLTTCAGCRDAQSVMQLLRSE